MFKSVTILAPGLLGASTAMAIKREASSTKIATWSRRLETRLKCEEELWCDTVHATAAEACENADLVVVCSPVETIAPLVREIRDALPEGCIVTDVGSTKSLLVREAHAAMREDTFFVGAHPMAGSEKTGLEHADADIFLGRACFVTPLEGTNEEATEKVVRFWSKLGLLVTTMSPEEHDEIVANISHLPHLMASALCSYLAGQKDGWRNFAGNGLRDTTRVASGSPWLWKEIINQNREEILRAINGLEDELHRLKSAIANNDSFEIVNILERGKAYRDRLRPHS